MNTLAAITDRKAGFRSLADAWADTTTAHGRLMLTVLGGLAEFEREANPRPHRRGPGANEGERQEPRSSVQADAPPEARGDQATRQRQGNADRDRRQLQHQRGDDFEACGIDAFHPKVTRITKDASFPHVS